MLPGIINAKGWRYHKSLKERMEEETPDNDQQALSIMVIIRINGLKTGRFV